MPDLYHYWGGDLDVSASGDLLPVDGTVLGQQRVLRRLLTNPAVQGLNGAPNDPGDYLFHLTYGAGLPRQVGRLVDVAKVRALIRGQILMEAAVARSPAPEIDVAPISGGMSVSIRYNDSQTKKPVFLSFDVNQ
ncbi:phage tail protein [Herbaspirillum sp. WKF16]|uniref:phage tail protein n=1 Tax=Herbaspirillum sp. WKF16 TaxID=3028312 RepID=UPI0023A99479|nr:phage tail protein [Herbaspirillum sp. WKF16]WDZ97992.1 phage tail protein [Herbaspirillum sp. WKF16]